MPVEYSCQNCRNLLRVPDESAGKMAKCPSCGAVTLVPAISPGAGDDDELQLAPLPPAPGGGSPPALGQGSPEQYVPPAGTYDPTAGSRPAQPDLDNPYASPQVSDFGRSQAGEMGAASLRAYARNRVSGPATAILIVGWIAVVLQVLVMCGSFLSLVVARGGEDMVINLVGGLLGMALYGSMIHGATQMKNLTSYGWSIAASILAMLPCSGCCLITLGFGIWGIVVLNDPQVKAGFAVESPSYRY